MEADGYPRIIGDGGSTAAIEDLPGHLVGAVVDTAVDWGAVGGLRVRAASVRGRMHRNDRTPRQDAFRLGATAGGALVLAVADGVSAAPSSHVAAAAATAVAAEVLAGVDDGGAIDWTALVDAARTRVLEAARAEAGDPDLGPSEASTRMATTLTVAVVDAEADGSGARTVRVLSFGDVSAWILRTGGTWEPVTAVKNAGSAIAESAVQALPLTYDGPLAAHEATVGAGEAFFLFSDGIGDPFVDGTGIVGTALAEAWTEVPGPYAFAEWVDFARRTHTDDRTAVGVWLPPAPEVPAST